MIVKKDLNIRMIKITHEFPLCYYLNGDAERLTDYDYCLIHRYLDHPEYRKYMKDAVAKGRIVYLDNSLYELGSAWSCEDYAKVIEELNPTYYMLPDVFDDDADNINSQLDFLKRYPYLKSIPIGIPHASTIYRLGEVTSLFDERLPREALIAIPFGDHSFKNKYREVGYFNSRDIPYEPLRMAQNRKLFLSVMAYELRNRKIHLLGCKSLAEFDSWGSEFNKSNIVSLDTSHPVAFSLEGNHSSYESGFFIPDEKTEIKMPVHFYKPGYLIDKHFDTSSYINVDSNVKYFQNYVKEWSLR